MSSSTPTKSTDVVYVSPFTSPPKPNMPKTLSTSTAARKSNHRTHHHRQPRSPLPPHRLAKLANALGVSTPLPASAPMTPNSARMARSPTPLSSASIISELRSASPASTLSLRPPTSRFLLHILPPVHFPHEMEHEPEDSSSFRRGTLVALHPTLQTQLGAIAREYAMPSTHGMVLYLVSGSGAEAARDGPRISEDIWKWLWGRVLDEQQEQHIARVGRPLSASTTSSPEGFNAPLRKLSSPASLLETPSRTGSAASGQSYPLTPSPSTPSSSSAPSRTNHGLPPRPPNPHLKSQSHARDGATEPEPETPTDSDPELDPRFLPGLGSTSMIPVLAKVEFDIDRKSGSWYETWCRSRRDVWQRQRATLGTPREGIRKLELRAASVSPGASFKQLEVQVTEPALDQEAVGFDADEENGSDEKVEEEGYAPLTDSAEENDTPAEPEDKEESENDEDNEDEITTRPTRGDPLSDVFGADAGTWSDLKSSRPPGYISDDLALDGASLGALSDLNTSDRPIDLPNKPDDEEVTELWNAFDRPRLNITIPDSIPSSPRASATPPADPKAIPPSLKRNAPPPLTFAPNSTLPLNIATATPSPLSLTSEGSEAQLAYLGNGTPTVSDGSRSRGEESSGVPSGRRREDSLSVDGDEDRYARRSPAEEKRGGGVFDNLDLDLDLSVLDDTDDFDGDDDPDDRRRSQIRMHHELDALERNLAQFSPRALKPAVAPEDVPHSPSLRSAPPASLGFGLNRETTPIRSASARVAHAIMTGQNSSPLMPALQHIPAARPSVEVEEEVTVMPPVFRQPVLVGTPSPIAESFVQRDRDSRASTSASARSTFTGFEGSSVLHQQSSVRPSWPAVPFASMPNDEIPATLSPPTNARRMTNSNSPPRLALNGASRVSVPGQRRRPSTSSSSILSGTSQVSAETQARIKELEEQNAHSSPSVLAPSLSRRRDAPPEVSPVMPLSPDPFSRFSSSDQSATAEDARNSAALSSPPKRNSSLTASSEVPRERERERPDSQVPSSRFSADSTTVEELSARSGKDRSTIISVKGIRKLWRKSNKSSMSAMPPPTPVAPSAPTPRNSPPRGQASIPESEYERSREPSPVPPRPPSKSPKLSAAQPGPGVKHGRSESGLDPFYFDQESRYPVRRSPSPNSQPQAQSAPGSRAGTPSGPSRATASPPPPPVPQAMMVPNEKEKEKEKEKGSSGVRKSILKWKSSTNLGNGNGGANGEQAVRKRRPSVLDVASSIMRGSLAPVHDPAQSPAVPELPAAYRTSMQASRHSRTHSAGRTTGGTGASVSSGESQGSAFSGRGATPGSSVTSVSVISPRASEEMSVRRSYDTVSQFEMVSPNVNSYGIEPSLSYPYNELDEDE